jgi:hypothetical protein
VVGKLAGNLLRSLPSLPLAHVLLFCPHSHSAVHLYPYGSELLQSRKKQAYHVQVHLLSGEGTLDKLLNHCGHPFPHVYIRDNEIQSTDD